MAKLPLEGSSQSALEKIFILLHAQTGHDFSQYKKSVVYRRVERRMGLHRIDRIATYLRFLQENPKETELLFKELLIGVTGFFRDPAAWKQMKERFIPALLASRPKGGMIRAWTPGCSTGEEAYTLAMVFKEAMEELYPAGHSALRIFATDLNHDAIDRARAGLYPAQIAADLSAKRLRRFFVREECGYRVGKEIREMVIFSPKNVITDPPFTKLDLLVCRNLLIYLTPELQKKLLRLFHYSMKPDGILFLGSAETTGDLTGHFTPLERQARIFRRLDTTGDDEAVEFPIPAPPSFPWIPFKRAGEKPTPSLQTLTDRFFLTGHAPASTLTNDQGDILYMRGQAGNYLEPPAGKTNWNIFAMAREGLRHALTTAFHKVLEQQNEVILEGLQVRNPAGILAVDISLQRITEPEALRGMVLTIFSEAAAPSKKRALGAFPAGSGRDARPVALQSRHRFQHTLEEQAILQEDVQSMNEELQAQRENLSTIDNDMDRLLEGTKSATLFLDETLRVERFTGEAARIVGLIPGDTGRLATDIASDLLYPGLETDVQEVLRTLISLERQINLPDGDRFSVRIMPCRTLQGRIAAVGVTFQNISVCRILEAEPRRDPKELETPEATGPDRFPPAPEGYLLLGGEGPTPKVHFADTALLGLTRDVMVKEPLTRFILPADHAVYHQCQKQLLATGRAQQCELRMVKMDKTVFWAHLAADTVRHGKGEPICRVVISDITRQRLLEEKFRQGIERYNTVFKKCSQIFSFFEIGHRPIDKSLSTDEQLNLLYEYATIRGCNRTLAANYGLRHPEEMVGLKIGQLFPRLARENVVCLKGFIENGYKISGAETKQVCKDGCIRYFSNSLIGHVEAGSLIKILGAKQDISWVKRARSMGDFDPMAIGA